MIKCRVGEGRGCEGRDVKGVEGRKCNGMIGVRVKVGR